MHARYNDALSEFNLCPKGLGSRTMVYRDGDRLLSVWDLNEECRVSTCHQLVWIASLPLVHTARRSYRLSNSVNYLDYDSA